MSDRDVWLTKVSHTGRGYSVGARGEMDEQKREVFREQRSEFELPQLELAEEIDFANVMAWRRRT